MIPATPEKLPVTKDSFAIGLRHVSLEEGQHWGESRTQRVKWPFLALACSIVT